MRVARNLTASLPHCENLLSLGRDRSVKAFSLSYRSSGTIQNGFEPRATRSQLSNALRQRFGWLSQVGPAERHGPDVNLS